MELTIEITGAYAISMGGFFILLILWNLRYCIQKVLAYLSVWVSKHFVYPQLLDRHRYLGPWTRADIVLQASYIILNGYCVITYKPESIGRVGLRAANLSLINLIPLFAGPYLNFLVDLLGIPLSTLRRLHRSAALMSSVLLLIHILTIFATRTSFPLHIAGNRWGLIGGSSLGVLIVASHSLFQKISYLLFRKSFYEIFLRTHQGLAILTAFAIWQHLASQPLFPRLPVYILAGICAAIFIGQYLNMLYRNSAFGRGFTQASICSAYDIVLIRLKLSRKLKIDGQYVGLWLWNPAVSRWSFLQVHPFVVASWSEEEQEHLDLFVQPRSGFTQKLLEYTRTTDNVCKSFNEKDMSKVSSSCLALFTGPHGARVSVDKYETILMVAGGFGIAAQLSYLKQLIYGYNTCKTRTRRIHLVWQLETIDILLAMVVPLNNALKDDTLDDGYILTISIYIEYRQSAMEPISFSDRATVYTGTANLEEILKDEAAGKYIKRLQQEKEDQEKENQEEKQEKTAKREDMLVMVSGTNRQRDQLRGLVRGYLDEKVSLFELEFQPA